MASDSISIPKNDVLVSLLQNHPENMEEGGCNEEEEKIVPQKRVSKVSAALRKISQLGTSTDSEHQQQDERFYKCDNNDLFGKYYNDTTINRKTGMTMIAPIKDAANNALPTTAAKTLQKVGNNYSKSIKSFFDKNGRTVSKSNIFDENDEALINFKKRRPWYRKFVITKRMRHMIGQLIEDWIFLALLGIIMALLSFGMDWAIEFLQTEHADLMKLIDEKTENGVTTVIIQYLLWVFYAILLVTASALFSFYIAPQAIGSGIPEMKTILRGVILKEYLTFRTLISKIIGLTLSLGSGLPIGKEGPFVHVASIVANLLSHLMNSFHGAFANESRSSEMLAAGCAVGVACTFSAPVGGVLFSIEVTSSYFAVRDYWRGFFAATCSATIFRLLRVVNKQAVTVVAFYQTSFPREAFYPSELPIFALVGLVCGIFSAAFILLQRNMILFLRRNKFAKSVFQKYWLVYPIFISFLVASLTFPDGFGRFIGGHQKFSKAATNFFDNCTFIERNKESERYCSDWIHTNWSDGGAVSPFITLSSFLVLFYFLAAVASTVPIPSGIFGPSFVVGGAFGRLVGEAVALVWTGRELEIFPGVYAVVGAAAFAGGVTHTVSVAVIVFELTGQLVYILPVMIAVLIANAVSSYLQPSIYDSIIQIKHLPFLPDIPHTSSNFHGICVEQFMTSNVKFLSKNSNYSQLENLLSTMPKVKAFPVVEDDANPILIGSCSRAKLFQALEKKVGHQARQSEANRRIKEAIADIDRRFKLVDKQRGSISTSEGKRPSIFDTLKIDEQNNSSPIVISMTAPTPTDANGTFDFSAGRRTQSTCIPEEPKSSDDESKRRRAKSSVTNRFTIVPVSHDKDVPIPGLRPGGRRGGLSVENTIEQESIAEMEEAEDEIRKSSNDTITTSTTNSIGTKQSSSLIASFKHGHNGPKSVNADSQASVAATGTTSQDMYHTIGGVFRNVLSFGRFHKAQESDDYDLSGDEKKIWEMEQLSKKIEFDGIGVDPAPFQLVEKSSLFKVHSLFSLLGLNRAYVTKCGRLVGVVALKDLRIAIEKVQDGTLFINSGSIYDAPPKLSTQLSFDGSHLMTRQSSTDEQDEDDAENDKLTRRPEVISRNSSQLGDLAYSQLAAELAKSQDEPLQNPNFLSVKPPLLSRGSDPCIATNIDEMNSHLEETRPYGSADDRSDAAMSRFQVSSPCPTARIDSLPTSPATSSKFDDSADNDDQQKRKKSRHVQITMPPTPDYKKTPKQTFDFSSSSSSSDEH